MSRADEKFVVVLEEQRPGAGVDGGCGGLRLDGVFQRLSSRVCRCHLSDQWQLLPGSLRKSCDSDSTVGKERLELEIFSAVRA